MTEVYPRYQILNSPGFFGPDDSLYEQGRIIDYTGVPNEQMLPLNEPAKKMMDAYLDGLEFHHRQNMIARGLSPDIRRPRDIADAMEVEKAADKKARVYATEVTAPAQMGHLVKGGKKSDTVIVAQPPEPIGRQKPIPILANMNQSDAS